MAKILVADDHTPVRFILKEALRTEDHEVFEASTGVEAEEILSEKSINLIITDIVMPGKGGLELIQLIAQTYPATKIITMSGNEYSALKQMPQVYAHFKKPFDIKVVLAAIDEALRGGA